MAPDRTHVYIVESGIVNEGGATIGVFSTLSLAIIKAKDAMANLDLDTIWVMDQISSDGLAISCMDWRAGDRFVILTRHEVI